MIIAEIGIQNLITRFANVSPFTYSFTLNISGLASFWTDVFGAENKTTDERNNVIGVYVRSTEHMAKMLTLIDCKNTKESYFFNYSTQTLYINFGLLYNPLIDYSELLKVVGFSDTAVVYIDDIPFLPLIKDAPKINQKQDMINYDLLAYSSGSISIQNQSGAANFLRELNIFSNDVALSFLDYDGRNEHTRSELTPLAWYLIENVDIGKQTGKITLQDVRKSLNGKLPNILFSAIQYPDIETDIIDNPIPLAFGTFKADAICTNGNKKIGNATYRVALEMQSITEVSCYNGTDEKWFTVIPVSSNPSTGEVVLSEKDARGQIDNGNWNPASNFPVLSNTTGTEGNYYHCTETATRNLGSGDIEFKSGEYAYFTEKAWQARDNVNIDSRKCQIEGIGYDGSKPSKVIAKLEYLSGGIEYNNSFYNISEITTEESTLGEISLYINDQKELNEIIRQLQEGANNRFRYEINADGLRTIRLDNLLRASSGFISREQIKENNELNIYTDKDTIAATIKVSYGNDFTVDKKPYVIDSSKEDAIAKSVRERPQIEFDTFMPSREMAITRAALEANRLGLVRRFVDVTLCGKEFLNSRIYDIITVELTDVREEWMGVWKCQVLAIAPDTTLYENKVTLVLVERVADIDDGLSLRVTTTGAIRKTSTGDNKVRITK